MSKVTADKPLVGLRLDQLSTHVAALKCAERFLDRYGHAIRAYLNAILRDPEAADEVMQELLLSLLRRGGADTWPGKGRFRDYLKAAARNAAITYLRTQGRRAAATNLEAHVDPRSSDEAADRALRSEWQRCVIARANQKLESCERLSPSNPCYTVLQVVTEFPHEHSPRHAEIASERVKRALSAEAFRKHVSRARRLMAEFIVNEVARGLGGPTAEDVEGELSELGLWGYVANYLPDDWRTRFLGS
jgi:RNA polymerase sigma factor (sigma-70 family)